MGLFLIVGELFLLHIPRLRLRQILVAWWVQEESWGLKPSVGTNSLSVFDRENHPPPGKVLLPASTGELLEIWGCSVSPGPSSVHWFRPPLVIASVLPVM